MLTALHVLTVCVPRHDRPQIALVKSFKRQAAAGPQKAPVRTSFRRKPKAESSVNRTAAVEEPINLDMRRPQLLVDGYNVINAWPRLKKRFAKGELDAAREMLLQDLADFAIGRYDAQVVFDANGAADRVDGYDRQQEYAGGLLSVVFAHDSADAYIERTARELRADGRQVHVATSDGAIATAVGVHGASVLSSRALVADLKASRKASAAVVEEFNRRQQQMAGASRPLWDALPSDMQAQWDASINEVTNRHLTKGQLAAKAQREDMLKAGELERGAAAARRKRLAAEREARRARPAADVTPQAGPQVDPEQEHDQARPKSPFDL